MVKDVGPFGLIWNVLICGRWIGCAEEIFFNLLGVALFYENDFSEDDFPSVKAQFYDVFLSVSMD